MSYALRPHRKGIVARAGRIRRLTDAALSYACGRFEGLREARTLWFKHLAPHPVSCVASSRNLP